METGTMVNGFGTRMDRRGALRLMMGAGAAVVAGGVLAKGASAATESGFYRTTTALNLREKPSTTGKVLLVIPAGAGVEYLGETKNGFRKVMYKGTWGWAHKDYLEVTNGGSDDPPVITGQAKTTTSVNFRSGPSSGHQVLKVLPKGTVVEYSDTERYGYRYVVHQGMGGWVYDDYLTPSQESGPISFTTTTAVNLRANPSTNAKVIKVVPAGATVIDYDLVMSNGFRGVDYNGSVGWISDAYLKRK